MTLVEVLMVVFIIGLATSVVVLTLPPRTPPEQKAAAALAQTVRQAQDLAILTGQPTGLDLSPEGYGVTVWTGQAWQPRGRTVQLDKALSVQLVSEQTERPASWPELVFDPTGVATPATLTLQTRRGGFEIAVMPDAEVRYETR